MEKPLPFVILETYLKEAFSEVGHFSEQLLSRAGIMKKALDDAASAMPSMSTVFYQTVKSVLHDLKSLHRKKKIDRVQLSSKLLQVHQLLSSTTFTSEENSVSEDIESIDQLNANSVITLEELGVRLSESLENITVKNICIVSRLIFENKDTSRIIEAYLLVMKQIEKTVKITKDVAGDMMRFVAIPGKAVQTSRNIFAYIHHKAISLPTIRKVYAALEKICLSKLKNKDKTGIGIIIYKFLVYAVIYYKKYHDVSVESLEKPLKAKKHKRNEYPPYKDEFCEFLRAKFAENQFDIETAKNNPSAVLREFKMHSGLSDEEFVRLTDESAYSQCVEAALRRIRGQYRRSKTTIV